MKICPLKIVYFGLYKSLNKQQHHHHHARADHAGCHYSDSRRRLLQSKRFRRPWNFTSININIIIVVFVVVEVVIIITPSRGIQHRHPCDKLWQWQQTDTQKQKWYTIFCCLLFLSAYTKVSLPNCYSQRNGWRIREKTRKI